MSSPPGQADAWGLSAQFWQWLAVAAVLLGAILRVHQFAAARPIWLDEAMLALNIGLRGPGELLRPLDFSQVVPFGYLWLLNLCSSVLGMSAWAVRLPALLAGMLLPFLAWRVGRMILAPAATALATALVALAPGLLIYSRELKPYGLEALISLALLGAAVAWKRAAWNRRSWWLLVGLALATPVFSIGPVIVALGTCLILAVDPQARRQGFSLRLVTLGLGVGAVFAVLALFLYSPNAQGGYMRSFWEGMNLQIPLQQWPGLLREVVYGNGYNLMAGKSSGGIDLLRGPLPGWIAAYVSIALGFLGAVGLAWRGRRTLSLLLSAPFILVLAASLVSGFPLAPRLLLFLAPQAIFLISAGVEEAVRRVRRPAGPVLGVVLAVVFLTVPALRATQWTLSPPSWADAGPVLRTAAGLLQPGDWLYVSARGFPVWLYASTNWEQPDRAEVRRLARAASYGGPVFHGGSLPDKITIARARLQTTWDGTQVLIGLSTGVGYVGKDGSYSRVPAAGWAEAEVQRINALRTSCVVLLFPYAPGGVHTVLEQALTAAGWQVGDRVASGDGFVARACRRE